MEGLLVEFASLRAVVWCEYAASIRWLEWLGFERGPQVGAFFVYTKERV